MTSSANTLAHITAVALLAASCSGAPASPADMNAETPVPSGDDAAPQDPSSEPGNGIVTFRDRTIDLTPYVQGFPWSIRAMDLEHDLALVTWSSPDGVLMHEVALDPGGDLDITAGRPLGSVDWSTRSLWSATYRASDDAWYLWADEQNEERMNVYRMSRTDGAVEAVTDNEYTSGWGFSRDERSLAWVARSGDGDPYVSCLHVRDLTDGNERVLWCDEGGADRLTWTGIEFSPDASTIIVRTQHDGDRNRVGLAAFDTQAAGEPALLLPRDVERYSVFTIDETFDGDTVLYVSAESGFDELLRLDIDSATSESLYDYGRDVTTIEAVEIEGHPYIVATLEWPHQTELVVVDPDDGRQVLRQALPATLTMLDAEGPTIAADVDAVDIRFAVDLFRLAPDAGDGMTVQRRPWGALPSALNDQIVQCRATRVEYPTFDNDEDGGPRMLHAFYIEPMNPPDAEEDRLVVITSFYGGGNYYSTTQHIMCEAGIASFSPAPRGSSGFGAAFSALNDRDLGGDEIVDIIEAARWLEQEYGYEPHQIGLRGGSHGGYATMRALTFPPETNGRDASFDFGFGMSHAGFSNILTFFEASNIPDWVILEAGDPATEADRLLDRSPIQHVDRLRAPLLLTHGSNDQRVPVEESRTFAAAAEEVGAPVTYVEFEGQGHGISGLDNTVRYFQTVFAFLQQLDAAE